MNFQDHCTAIAGEIISPLIRESDVGMEEVDSVLDRHVLDRFKDVRQMPRSCRKGASAIFHLLCDRYNLQLVVRSRENAVPREDVMSQLYTTGGTVGIANLEQMIDSSSVREALSVLNGTHLEPYFKEAADKGAGAVEVALDRMLLDGSVGLSHTFNGNVGPTIRYLVSKEMELKNLRVLMQGAFSGWDPERIRNMLVTEGTVR